MLPYLAQGANSAVEDGAVLGLLLGSIRSKDQLPKALELYENLRKVRGEAIVRETFKQVKIKLFPISCISLMLTIRAKEE
jgi:salicylate hydroxylase